jgi:hypothetical protein
MKLRVVDILLLAVIAVGGVFVWKTGQERSRLTARYGRLAAITGELKITDTTKVHFQALETDDPMHFAWRIYYPPKYKPLIAGDDYDGGWWSKEPTESIGRVRFHVTERGDLDHYVRFPGGGQWGLREPGAPAKFLIDHWNELQIEQIGTDGLAVVNLDETVSLLRITFPDDLRAEAETLFPERLVPVYYELKLGPDAAKP